MAGSGAPTWPAGCTRGRRPGGPSSPTAVARPRFSDCLHPVTPLVFAHRGASADLSEHTRGAYLRAIADGADGFECDVRLTRDGHLVCIHDGTVDRTSGGRGRVTSSTLDELRQLDFAGPAASEAARILTLHELLGIARGAGRPVRLLVETKHPSRFGSAVE